MTKCGVRETISTYLDGLEQSEAVRVLYAVESGSRAWGFESPDSDFDIRFIYVRPQDWYLSVQKRRDVIEAMVEPDLDFAGWDLPKALGLLRKSNPSLLEWLASPIVYREDTPFMLEFRELAEQCVSLHACFKHYLSMATTNWQANFSSDSVLLKKYFYVLRPVFSCRWIERYRSAPPVAFSELVDGQGGEVALALEGLLAAKAVTSELGTAARIPTLDRFIETELERIHRLRLDSAHPVDFGLLDRFFRKWIP
jgi:predicted nucleotidyltransferase